MWIIIIVRFKSIDADGFSCSPHTAPLNEGTAIDWDIEWSTREMREHQNAELFRKN